MKPNSKNRERKLSATCSSTALRLDRNRLIIVLLLIICTIGGAAQAGSELSLTEAINKALDHSYGLDATAAQQQAAKYDYYSIRSERFPTISLSAGAHYIDNLVKVDAFPGGLELGSKENYQTDLRMTIPLYTGGRLSGQINSLRAMYNASGSELESKRIAVAYRGRLAWLRLSLSDKLVKAARASLNRIDIIKSDISHLYDNGLADSVDIFNADYAFEDGHQQLLKAQNNRNNASTQLASLIGADLTEPITTAETETEPPTSFSGYKEMSITPELLKRPELKALQYREAAAQYQVGLSKSGYLPNLSGYAGYSYGKPNRDQFSGDWDHYFITGVSLNWSFNLGLKTGQTVSRAKQQLTATRMAYKELEENLTTAAEAAMENLKLAYDLYQSSMKKFEITKNRFRLADAQLKAGMISSNRLLEIEAELTAAEQGYFASLIEYYIYESDYLYAIGSDNIYKGF